MAADRVLGSTTVLEVTEHPGSAKSGQSTGQNACPKPAARGPYTPTGLGARSSIRHLAEILPTMMVPMSVVGKLAFGHARSMATDFSTRSMFIQEPIMSLEEIFYVSQTAASVAVVGSLIYLGLQVRAGDRNQRAIMQQGRADRTSHAALTLASPELASVFQKGMAGDPALTREEFNQWMLICRAAFLSGEDSFLQHRAGLLDKPAFDSYVAGARFYLASPGLRAVWKLSGGQFGSDFRDFVTSMMDQTPVARGGDAFCEWQKLLQSEGGASTR